MAARVLLSLVLVVGGCLATPERVSGETSVRGERAEPLTGDVPFDKSVPVPAQIIGHELGDGAVRYDDVIRYIHELALRSPLVTITPYAESHEGRILYYLTITSAKNHARLDDIRDANGMLSDPRRLSSEAEAEGIIEKLPGIAWLAYSIHGDELSGTDASLQVAYHLAAAMDEATARLRDELVIHIDPMQNPDGRERYLNQLESLNGKVVNRDYQAMQHSGLWSAGRGNHYLFDLNRDWAPQVHPETRGRAAEILRWHPHLVIDAHEMGPLDTYLFDPPREPYNTQLAPRTLSWRRTFSKDQAAAFDAHGWSYYTGEWYEEWYPGYTNAWSSLVGAIGILYEQASVDGSAIVQASGKALTYREAVHHQVTSSLANLESLRENRAGILEDFLADRKWAVSVERSGQEVFLVPPHPDVARRNRFIELLELQGIEFEVASATVEARGVTSDVGESFDRRTFPPGTVVVRAAQPQRRLLMALLDFDPRMTATFLTDERRQLESHRSSKLYDVTSWNLGMAYGIGACWARQVDEVQGGGMVEAPAIGSLDEAAYGYAIDGSSSSVYAALGSLFRDGVKVRVADKRFSASGHTLPAGSLLIRNHENDPGVRERVLRAAKHAGAIAVSLDTARASEGPDLGGGHFPLLESPRVAIAQQWPISSTSFGSFWHLLDDRVGLGTSPVNVQSIGRIDLRRYNVLVIPDSWGGSALGAIFDSGGASQLREWLRAGGTLIATGSSASFFADESHGISSVRRRRDVLDELDEYERAALRELRARDVEVQTLQVWGSEEERSVLDSLGPPEVEGTGDAESRKRDDEWKRMFSPTGVIAKASLDNEHWINFGVAVGQDHSSFAPVFVGGGTVLMSKVPVRTPVRLVGSQPRLSGLMWPEAQERHSHGAMVTVERVGAGQVILFASDPVFRGYYELTARMLLNAILLGPGVGTSQPVPLD